MKKTPLNLRIDAKLRKQLEELANKENRTLSNMVETLLTKAVTGVQKE